MLASAAVVVVLSLLIVAQRAAQPRTAVLVRNPATGGYRSADNDPDDSIPGLIMYRFDAPLFFANATQFADEILALVEEAIPAEPDRGQRRGHHVSGLHRRVDASRPRRPAADARGGVELARAKKPLRDFPGSRRAARRDRVGARLRPGQRRR